MGEWEQVEETQNEVRDPTPVDPAPSPTNRTRVDPVPCNPVWFDWAWEVNADIGLSPIAPAPANPDHTPTAPNNCTPISTDPTPTVINPAPAVILCMCCIVEHGEKSTTSLQI